MLKGFFYSAISKYSSVLVTILISAVLSRLLTPEDFGIIALVSVFITFFNLLGNIGIGPAIIQNNDLSKDDLRSIFSFSALVGVTLSFLFYLSADLISGFYSDPQLIPVVRLLSLSIFFNIVVIVPSALNRKNLHFKKMGIINVSVQIGTGILAIVMAYFGFGYYTLIYQSIVSSLIIFFIFYYFYPIVLTTKIKKSPLKKIASFSSYQFAFNFINYFSRNLDNILIGKYMGNAPLGFYNKSYTLMLLPIRNLTHVITPVLHPVLAQHQDDKKFIFNQYLLIVKILAFLGFPLSVFLYYSSSELILIMFGNQWIESIPVFKILSISVGIQICLSSSGSIFQAVNRTDLLFVSGLISSVFMVAGIIYGVFYGGTLEDVGYGLLIAFLINFFQGFYILIRYALNESFLEFLRILIAPLFLSVILIMVMELYLRVSFQNYILNIIVKTLILLLSLLIITFMSKDIRNIIKKLLRKKG